MFNNPTRRDFLRWTGNAAGVALLAACTVPAPPPAPGAEVLDPPPASELPVIRYAGMESMAVGVERYLRPWLEANGYGWERITFLGPQEVTDKIMQSVATGTYLADMFQMPSNARAGRGPRPGPAPHPRTMCWTPSTLRMCSPAL